LFEGKWKKKKILKSRKMTERKPRKKTNKIKINDKTLEEVEKYSKMGLLDKDIASLLGYSYQHFSECIKRIPEISEALEKGRVKNKEFLLSRILKAVSDGTWTAAAWILERKYPEEYGKIDRDKAIDLAKINKKAENKQDDALLDIDDIEV